MLQLEPSVTCEMIDMLLPYWLIFRSDKLLAKLMKSITERAEPRRMPLRILRLEPKSTKDRTLMLDPSLQKFRMEHDEAICMQFSTDN
jgi:hypothetical protein